MVIHFYPQICADFLRRFSLNDTLLISLLLISELNDDQYEYCR